MASAYKAPPEKAPVSPSVLPIRRRNKLHALHHIPALTGKRISLRRIFDFGVPAPALDRLPQGPFAIEDDGGWLLAGSSTPDAQYRANPGMGFVGYAWEESGPSLMARAGRETLEQHLSHLLAFPFTDVLYIRCDWRDVQSAPGQLALSPIWEHTFDMARKAGKRVAFRIQSSQTGGQPERYSLPDFLRQRIPYVTLRKFRTGSGFPDTYQEPDYTSPAFFDALCELNRLVWHMIRRSIT